LTFDAPASIAKNDRVAVQGARRFAMERFPSLRPRGVLALTIAALALAVGILRWSGGPIHETFGEVKSVVAVNDARGAGQVASVALGDGRIVTAWVRPEHATKAGERVRILSLGRPISGGPAYEVVGRKET
jgi:hypothetical protein